MTNPISSSFASGKSTYLINKLTPGGTLTVSTDLGVQNGRLYFQNDQQVEWIDFESNTVSGSYWVLGTLTRDIDPVAIPAVSNSTGKTWLANNKCILVEMHDQMFNSTQGGPFASRTSAQLAARTNKVVGETFWDTTQNMLVYWNGAAYITIAATGAVANATTTSTGGVELATTAESKAGTNTGSVGPLSVLPSDIAANTQSATFVYGADVGGDDTYVVALVPVLTAYTVGQILTMKVTTPNTGACSVDFGPGVLNIKDKFGRDPLDGYITGTVQLRYDGTNMVIDNPYIAPKWGGTGADGAIGAGNLTIAGSNNTYIVKNYTDFAPGANTVTVTPTNCIVHIKVSGNLNLTGTAHTFNAKGAAGGVGAAFGSSSFGSDRILVGGGNPNGTTSAGIATTGQIIPSLQYAIEGGKNIVIAPGSGGGGVTGAINGGAGGGCIFYEVAGNVTLSGTTATVAGANGTAGAVTQGGAGGGGGGTFVILYNGTLSGSLTPTVTGGAGGAYGGGGATIYPGGGGGSIVGQGTVGNVGTGVGGPGADGAFYIAKNVSF